MHFQPKIKPIGLPAKMRCIQKPTPKFQCGEDLINQQFYRNNPFVMAHPDMTMSQTMPTEVMNQMMNCSYQQQQQHQRFMPTNPFDDGNIHLPSNQNFYERNLKFQHQQQLQAIKRDFFNSSGFSTGGSCSSSSSAYEANMQQQYSMMTPTPSFYSRYEPPKPDTPPSKPLWLDPVWNCDGNMFGNRSNSSNSNSGNYGNSDAVRNC